MSTKEKPFIEAIKSKFITLPGEKLIFIQRKHWSTFGFPLAFLCLTAILIVGIFAVALQFLTDYFIVLISSVFVVGISVLSLALRSIIDWYFNIYVVTNRKIIEISYSPLAAHTVNQVLLDQVRCTEIDTKIEGIINDILDIGHVMITFDRPTHQEQFIFAYVKDPRDIEKVLQNTVSGYNQRYSYAPMFDAGIYNKGQRSLTHPKWTYTEEIGNNTLQKDVVWNI